MATGSLLAAGPRMPSDPTQTEAPRTVAVTGATGLIGSALVTRLRAAGYIVRRLLRSPRHAGPGDVVWDPARGALPPMALDGVDAVVHLAGEPVAHRWTADRKRAIRDSRVRSTELLAQAVRALPRKPRVLLSGSAVGYYGNRGDELLDEASPPGTDFLAQTCVEWERATAPVADAGVRVVLLRTGIVVSPHGGALARLLPIFRLGGGGPIGSGRQWMSWIGLGDHVRAMLHALVSEAMHGPVNLVAPNPVTNADFATTLGRVLTRPALVPVPAFALELLYGEMARATLLAGQRALPKQLMAAGFAFEQPTLEGALRAELNTVNREP
jgi:uncharacterized protein (TIGR01777 family)